MTVNELSTIAAILLSLVFSYIPGIKSRYEPLDGTVKRLIMLLSLAVTTAAAFGLACWHLFSQYINIQCTQEGAVALLIVFGQAIVANQATFLIAPKPHKENQVRQYPKIFVRD